MSSWSQESVHEQADRHSTNEGVQIEEIKTCLLCGSAGQLLHSKLRDRLFGTPGLWSLHRCPQDGLVWLSPRPTAKAIERAYATYYTHAVIARSARIALLPASIQMAIRHQAFGYTSSMTSKTTQWLGSVLSWVPLLRDTVGSTVMWLRASEKGKLLDVGCGSGDFLATMRGLGWDVHGVEPDSTAATIARERHNLKVFDGTLHAAEFPDDAFDAVTLSHVIEHVHDVDDLLAECRRVLKPGGRLVVLTPNVESLGHRLLGDSWRGLEPPRHLHIFSSRSLANCIQRAGLQPVVSRTTTRSARAWWYASRQLVATKPLSDTLANSQSATHLSRRLRIGLERFAFQIVEEVSALASRGTGEELLSVMTKT